MAPEKALPTKIAQTLRALDRTTLTKALVAAVQASPREATSVLREAFHEKIGATGIEGQDERIRAVGAAALLAVALNDFSLLDATPDTELHLLTTSYTFDDDRLLSALGPALAPRLAPQFALHAQANKNRDRPPFALLHTAEAIHAVDTIPAIENSAKDRGSSILKKMFRGPDHERDVKWQKKYQAAVERALGKLRSPLPARETPADDPSARQLHALMEEAGLLFGRRQRVLTVDAAATDPQLDSSDPEAFALGVLEAEGLYAAIHAEGDALPPYDEYLALAGTLSDGAAVESIRLEEDPLRLHWTENGTPEEVEVSDDLAPWLDLTALDELIPPWTDDEGRSLHVYTGTDSAGMILAPPGAWERYLNLAAEQRS